VGTRRSHDIRARHPRASLTPGASGDIRQGWLEERLETVLPRLMREHHIDMWIAQMSEYNEDPVFRALVSPTRFAARRRSIFVFYDRGSEEGVERLALGGEDQGGVYTALLEPERPERELYLDAQWRMLREVVEEREPEVIGINVSRTHAFPVPEWDGQEVRIALEEDAAMNADGSMERILRRQEQFHLVR